MKVVNLSSTGQDTRAAIAAIIDEAGVTLADCYQCGKCSAGCPMADAMDISPRGVIRLLQLGLLDEALSSKSPWLCAQCEVCSARCPQNVEIAALMRAVRHAAKDAGKRPVPDADTFDKLFIKNVRSHGVSNEQYLALSYNISSGHLMQDVASAPAMLKRGMVGIKAHNIKGRAGVASLIDRALANGAAKHPFAAVDDDDVSSGACTDALGVTESGASDKGALEGGGLR